MLVGFTVPIILYRLVLLYLSKEIPMSEPPPLSREIPMAPTAPLAPLNTLVVAPALPVWLPEIVLTNLRVGDSTATLRFWRGEKGRSHAEILEKKGTLHLIHQQPPESLTAGPWDRFRALLDTVVH